MVVFHVRLKQQLVGTWTKMESAINDRSVPIDYVPELLSWHTIYRYDDRIDNWVRWTSVDTERYGMEFVELQIRYCNESYPNQKIRVMKFTREEVKI